MKRIVWLLLFATQLATAQRSKKTDSAILANDKLEGGKTGSVWEELA